MTSVGQIIDRLSTRVDALSFHTPVAYVYNPLDYARAALQQYMEAYAQTGVRAILLGMNPGPWGMAQTGVPFGAVEPVREWLGIDAPIGRPKREHPKRPVLGLRCPRNEVSGMRLWGWARDTFGTPKRFFRMFFVYNYCPLLFLEDGGRNRTPDKLPAEAREPLFDACDDALRKLVALLGPKYVIGVGAFSERRALAALPDTPAVIGRILHPSPASPAANRDWAGTVARQLTSIGALPRSKPHHCASSEGG